MKEKGREREKEREGERERWLDEISEPEFTARRSLATDGEREMMKLKENEISKER